MVFMPSVGEWVKGNGMVFMPSVGEWVRGNGHPRGMVLVTRMHSRASSEQSCESMASSRVHKHIQNHAPSYHHWDLVTVESHNWLLTFPLVSQLVADVSIGIAIGC
jgi:hypothetical protein